MYKSIAFLSIALVAGALSFLWAGESSQVFNYIKAGDLHKRLGSESEMIIIDVCPAVLYSRRHIKGSIETNAYPVKTDAEKARLAPYLPRLKSSPDDIVLVCPRGGGGAMRTFHYLKANGIDENRMLILENGITGWPYEFESK